MRPPRWRARAALAGLACLAAGACTTPAPPEVPATPERPQLTAAAATTQQAADFLAQGPSPWQPESLPDTRTLRPDFVVAADGSGTHRSVQAALDALPARPAAPGQAERRLHVFVKPGRYREIVCVRDKVPFLLYGSAADAGATVIVEGRYNAQAKRPGIDPANPCDPALAAASFGTAGSASVALFSSDVQVAHLTIANDAMDGVKDGVGYPPGAGESGGAQAVALMTRGDRIQLHGVRLLGHQDTLMVRAAAPASGTDTDAARVHVTDSLIAGDVDFIFGNATLVIERSTIRSRAGRRKPGNGGHVLAPSTAAATRLGFLVTNTRFDAEAGLASGSISLGRAWDYAVPRGAWQASVSPNGQALVRDSQLGAHLGAWSASTSRRPFSASGPAANRMAEFRNMPLGERDIARQVLGADDGWAAAEGGTRGGADAQAEHVLEVRNRSELAAAFALGDVPKIVQVRGRIDLSVDDTGRSLGFDDYRDPAFDPGAFEAAYAPATWGRKKPEGPLEDARRRSARNQAARVVLRVPSNTTLLGLGSDARIVNGMLLLDGVRQVIVRHIHFSDAFDHFPAWDPNDNASGEWNADYDNLSLRRSTHVWVDHCTFDDGARPDASARSALGRRLQHHDGLLDVTQQSDFVTLSWNHFRDHDKTSLVGSGDGVLADAGRLRVTYHHNLWERTMSRQPRVRYGQVHVFNNLYVGSHTGGYPYDYAIGLGHASRVFSEHNVWETTSGSLVKRWNGNAFFDRGSLHHGRPVDLLAALRAANPGVALSGDAGWVPPHRAGLDDAAIVAARVRAGAGAGR